MCLDNRTIQHQDLHPKTAVQEELFHTSTSLDWQPMTDHSRGMHSVSDIIIERSLSVKHYRTNYGDHCLMRRLIRS